MAAGETSYCSGMRATHHSPDTSLVLVVLAALCWGISGGIAGILVRGGWDPAVVALYRGAIGLLIVLAWLAVRPHRSGLGNHRLWLWAGLAGLGVAGNFTFFFLSIEHGTVAVAATLMYCAPVWVYLVSFALKLEASSPAKWVAIALVMVGVVLLTGIYDVEASNITPLGIAAGLLSGGCYALFIFSFKNATRYGSPRAILVLAFAVLVVVLAVVADLGQVAAASRSADWPLFVLLGVLGAGVSFILYVVGMRGACPTRASVVAMIEPVTAALFAFALLGESLSALQLAGMVLMLGTVTALSVHRRE